MTEMIRVDSSNVEAIGHDDDTRELRVQFLSGGCYIYHDVPRRIFDELMCAPSKGSFLNREVKGVYLFTKEPAVPVPTPEKEESMDPDECLNQIRQLSERIRTAVDTDKPLSDFEGETLATLVDTLDGWITKGGIYPKDWARCAASESDGERKQ